MLSLSILAIVFLGVYVFKQLRSPLAKIPGPPITAISSIWLKLYEFTGHRRGFVHRLHQQYGHVVRLSPNEVSFSSVNGMKEIYTSHGSGFDKTEIYEMFIQFNSKSLFSTLQRAEHGPIRRQIAGQYAMKNILRPPLLAAICGNARAFVSKCTEDQGKSIDIYELVMYYSLDCISHFLFGSHGTNSMNNPTARGIVNDTLYWGSLKMTMLIYYLPWLAPYIPTSLTSFAPNLARNINEYVLSMKNRSDTDEHALINRLDLQVGMNWLSAAAECKDHLMAGIDGVGTALCYILWYLSQPQNVTVQQRLYRELTVVELEEALKNPYLDAVIKEGLRCMPLATVSLPRYTPVGGCTIDGYFIPGGTVVSCQAWTLHRMNENVFPQPDKFWPERWLDNNGAPDQNRLFFTFSVGGRGCIGKNLAIVEMKILLREIYSRFQTVVAPDMSGSMEPYDQILQTRPKDQTCKLVFSMI